MLAIPCAELRANLSYVLNAINNNKSKVVITHRGKPVAQIVAVEVRDTIQPESYNSNNHPKT